MPCLTYQDFKRALFYKQGFYSAVLQNPELYSPQFYFNIRVLIR